MGDDPTERAAARQGRAAHQHQRQRLNGTQQSHHATARRQHAQRNLRARCRRLRRHARCGQLLHQRRAKAVAGVDALDALLQRCGRRLRRPSVQAALVL